RQAQFVDVCDVADFIVRSIEHCAGGDYNVTSPQGYLTMGGVLAACANVARVPHTVAWAEDQWLVDRDVAPWMGPSSLPLWIPPSLGYPGFMNCDVRKALRAGLTIRPLRETARDTLGWARSRTSTILKSGLTPERERTLLEEFRNKSTIAP
ncbi:MAG: hypothetical protein JO199_03195, partial [Candidatus Eremiobacteraeota bacterium]|nr:hypothetical protein [Candidatus Eremiobacteraeota bacterium]